MTNWLKVLGEICSATPDRFEAQAFVLSFCADGATITIRIVFEDEQSGADMVITNMTTLPDSQKSRGHGSKALQQLLKAVTESGLEKIQAVQVQAQSERFWTRNSFRKMGNVTNDFFYTPTGDASC